MFKKMMVITVLVLFFGSPVLASSKKEPSPSNCADLGALEIKCFKCTDNESKYLGNAAVIAVYNETNGSELCVKMGDALHSCSRFGVEQYQIGYKAEYKLGSMKYTERLKSSCINRAGH